MRRRNLEREDLPEGVASSLQSPVVPIAQLLLGSTCQKPNRTSLDNLDNLAGMESKEDDSKDAFLGETKVPRQPHVEPSVEISQMQTVDGNGPGLVGHLLRHLSWEHPHWPVNGIDQKIGGNFNLLEALRISAAPPIIWLQPSAGQGLCSRGPPQLIHR